ncbi:MAG: DNA-3-methyladenine glycosylase 2 family protein [Alphaproteobacteria bacterium]|nr:DNA-3-methyladenine glycosylase 2 family protein [Alphaproteobacteria bacterium]
MKDRTMLPKPFSWDRAEARSGKFDGKFIIGVRTTGIYCLPSCPVHPPKPENVTLYRTEEAAQAAGLRACKRCRPDLYYRGMDENLSLFEGLLARVRADVAGYADTSALAKAAGVSQTKLSDLFRTHAHLAPAAWLRRERVRAASRLLLTGEDRVVDVGYAAGFESESVFHRQFLAQMRMTPGAYRALMGAKVFLLQLPAGYRPQEILAYHDRDKESPCERVEGSRIFKALVLSEGAAVLEVSLEGEGVWCCVHTERMLSRASMASLHASALRMLGLVGDVSPFETRMARETKTARFFSRRKGLRVPLIPTGFDALAWAIIGQQINVPFAAALRREIIHLAGERIGDMQAHPSPERVAELGVTTLTGRRYSRSKADYLIGAAREVAEGRLAIETLGEGSAVAAEKTLTTVRGIGTWTARYVLLRTGFADATPVGDSALATALQRFHALPDRPAHEEVDAMMKRYSPNRSLATCHLWASLKDAA